MSAIQHGTKLYLANHAQLAYVLLSSLRAAIPMAAPR